MTIIQTVQVHKNHRFFHTHKNMTLLEPRLTTICQAWQCVFQLLVDHSKPKTLATTSPSKMPKSTSQEACVAEKNSTSAFTDNAPA